MPQVVTQVAPESILDLPSHVTARPLRQTALLHLQQSRGNAHVQRLFPRQQADESQIQRRGPDDEGMTFSEMWAKAVMEDPKVMAIQAKSIADDIAKLLSQLKPGEPYFETLYTTYWGFGKLIVALKKMPDGATTTLEQRNAANNLAQKWANVKASMEANHKRQMKKNLAKAREGARALQIQLLYSYHDIYAAGKEPEDVKLGGLDTMKGMAEKGVDLLKAINEADAGISGRSITPVIPVLDKILSIVNVIAGWKVTSSLAADSTKAIAALQNALSLANTGLSLTGFGKFLPLFSYIGPLLDGIAKGWGRLVAALSKKNRMWWEAREVVGDDLPHPGAEPGGRAVFSYMKKIYKVSAPPSGNPSDKVVEFFDDNREMFTKSVKEVMGKSWSKVPTKRTWYLFGKEADPNKLNKWVFYNKDMVWRLIYGRGMEPPTK
ncbi:MAG: hypothetical protein GY796_03495 [Chloroflexi bacterium]|nr:hypothetical protein [Chloroflexota bacterium]